MGCSVNAYGLTEGDYYPPGEISSTDIGPGLRLSAMPCFSAETYALPKALTGSAERFLLESG
jgi:hypothetical protein